MKRYYFLLALLLPMMQLRSQSLMQEAAFHLRSAEYSLSLEKSLQAYQKEFTPEKFNIIRTIARSYEKMGKNQLALHWYAQLIHPNNTYLDDLYYYAICLKNNGLYEKAISYFKDYQLRNGLLPISGLVSSCKNALIQTVDSSAWAIRNMLEINTDASEFGWIRSDSGFFITSDRHVDTLSNSKYKWTGLPYQKIFNVRINKNRDSIVIDTLPAFINHNYSNVGALTLSPSGDTLFFTLTDTLNLSPQKVYKKKEQIVDVRNGIFISVRKNHTWQKPVAFLYNNQNKYQVMHPAIDQTGNVLVFASDQPGGYGGLDLYYSVKERDSFWSPPCNLGAVVNSEADEVFPVFDQDGKLRFSSNRVMGRGALDIYELSTLLTKDTAVGLLIHLPYPFNSYADDFYLIDGDPGNKYFSSNRSGGKGLDDIYEVKQVKKPVVRLDFNYKDSIDARSLVSQPFIKVEDVRTKNESIQMLSAAGSIIIPVTDSTIQRIVYYSVNGNKYSINDTIQYHPSYPSYGIIKKYPMPVYPDADEKNNRAQEILMNTIDTSIPKKKKRF